MELVLPPACRLCNGPVDRSHDFCGGCETALTMTEPMMRSACLRCGFPRPHVASVYGESDESEVRLGPPTGDQSRCAACKKLDFQFDGVAPLWAYQLRVRDAVVAAKYAHHSPLADALGRRLGPRIDRVFAKDLPDLVTFVPSHVTRQLARGGNGVSVLAAAVAKSIRRPLASLLRTTRRIDKQALLDDARRVENVRDAFSVKKSYAFPRLPEIASRHILVVDDVLTTGATGNEVARVLHQRGARRVSMAVVARAVRGR